MQVRSRTELRPSRKFAMRRGNLVNLKTRLQHKAIRRHMAKLIAIDRQAAAVVELIGQIVASELFRRKLPKIVKK